MSQQAKSKFQDRVDQELSGIIDLFSSREIVGYCARALIQAPEIPSSNWSLGNQIIVLLHGTTAAAGIRQWEELKRIVKKDTRAFYILRPAFANKKDEQGNFTDEIDHVYFVTQPVFRLEDTQGEFKKDQNGHLIPKLDSNGKEISIQKFDAKTGAPLFKKILAGRDSLGAPIIETVPDMQIQYEEEPLPEYVPRQIPLLADVAKKWNIGIRYVNNPKIGGANGAYDHETNTIFLATEDQGTFFHELAHKAHGMIEKLKPGQDQEQEAIAQLASCVLSRIFGFDDLAYSWNYIASYAGEKSTKAVGSLCLRVLSKVQKIVMLILAEKEALEIKEPVQ